MAESTSTLQPELNPQLTLLQLPVGVISLEFIEDSDPRRHEEKIQIIYDNVGALPATTGTVHLRMISTVENGTSTKLGSKKHLLGALFPGEKKHVRSEYRQFFDWRNKDMQVDLEGHLEYYLGSMPYVTKFEGKCIFVKGQKPSTSWQNIEAIRHFSHS